MKLIKGDNVITSTEKAYNLIYKPKGYVVYSEVEEIKPTKFVYDDMTKSQIMDELSELNIEYNSKNKKQELFELLGSDV